jgi:ribonuclease R
MVKSKKNIRDPHAAREASRYDNPIPSRELILELLADADGPRSLAQVEKLLGLKTDQDHIALERRLRAMERDGQLIKNRKGSYGLVLRMDLIKGRVIAHRDGFGFVSRVGEGEDIYLSSRQMARVFDGDEVLVRIDEEDFRGRSSGVIVEVLVRNTSHIVGKLVQQGGIQYVVADNPKVNHDIQLQPGAQGNAQSGQIVSVEIVEQPEFRRKPVGKVVDVLGDHMAPGMEIDIALRSHDLPWQFPQAVLDEAEAFGPEVAAADKEHRVDLRKFDFVTIDGEDARDFDDAVYCERLKLRGWRLRVAIADVSHYVKVGSALDQEAHKRGTSVYFPERVIPMLPEAISNGLCSLNPKVDRLAMVCEMTISGKGKLSSYSFYEGVIRSSARLTYTQVGQFLDGDDSAIAAKVHKPVRALHKLYQTLRQARERRGAIDFETEETRIVFGEDRKIETIVPVVRNAAHKLIEECMLSANVCAADFLQQLELPGLFRVHEGPKVEKLEKLRTYLGELGLSLGGGEKPDPGDYQNLLQQAASRPDAHIIQAMMLRSMNQAVYQPENLGHFGLHYAAYAHFTSPIRRYPDLTMHRALRSVIRSRKKSKLVRRVEGAAAMKKSSIYPYDMAQMLALGEHCSMTERRADDATRDVVAWLKCEYLHEHVGEEYQGVISAVTSFGLFVELVDVYIEGLVHVSTLRSDYYHFDAATQRLVGEHSRTSYGLGDSLEVKLVRVDLDDRKIDLEPVGASTETAPGKPRNSRNPRKRKRKKRQAKG